MNTMFQMSTGSGISVEVWIILLLSAAVICFIIAWLTRRKPAVFGSPEDMGRHTLKTLDYSRTAEDIKEERLKLDEGLLLLGGVKLAVDLDAQLKLSEYNREHIVQETMVARELLLADQQLSIAQKRFDAEKLRAMTVLVQEAQVLGLTLEDLMAIRRQDFLNRSDVQHKTYQNLLRMKILLLAKGIKDGRIGEADIGRELRELQPGSE